MTDSLQELAGEVTRLRGECEYFTRALDALERIAAHQPWLADAQHDEIARATRSYAHSAKDNLERATDDLRNWSEAVDRALRVPWSPPLTGEGY